MRTKQLISPNEVIEYHQLEHTFITDLLDSGLLELKVVDKTTYIPESELQKLEKMIRLHDELDINVAGIEAISHLLQRIEEIQEEMRVLKNSLSLYE